MNQKITRAIWASHFQNFGQSTALKSTVNIFRFPILSQYIKDTKNKTPGYHVDIFLILTSLKVFLLCVDFLLLST